MIKCVSIRQTINALFFSALVTELCVRHSKGSKKCFIKYCINHHDTLTVGSYGNVAENDLLCQ